MTSEQLEVVTAAKAVIAAHDEADLGMSQECLGKAISNTEEPKGGWIKAIRTFFVDEKLEEKEIETKLETLKQRFAF